MTIAQLVQRAEYQADQRAIDQRFVNVERDVSEVKTDLAADIKALRQAIEAAAEKRGSNWRQALYSGILPGVFILLGIVVQIWLAASGGG